MVSLQLVLVLHGRAVHDPRVGSAVEAARLDGHLVDVRITTEAGDASRLAAEAVEEAKGGGVHRIVAGGGDGTVNEVFAAAYRAGPPPNCSFGVLPLGTANDFAHATGIPISDAAAAMRLIVSTPARLIDFGVLNGRPFVNLVSGGFGSRVTAETDPELKRRLGRLAYLLTGVARFQELSASEGCFRAQDFAWEGRFLALAIGNGRLAGGGIPLCPNAFVDDGLLDLSILPGLPSAARLVDFEHILREGMSGLDLVRISARSPWIEYEGADEISINLDGEPTLARRFRVECRSRVLPVHVGTNSILKSGVAHADAQ